MGDAGFGTLGCGTENSVFQQPSGYSEVELNTDHLNSLTSAVLLAYGLGKMVQLESTCCLWMSEDLSSIPYKKLQHDLGIPSLGRQTGRPLALAGHLLQCNSQAPRSVRDLISKTKVEGDDHTHILLQNYHCIQSCHHGLEPGLEVKTLVFAVWNQEPHTSRVCESQRSPVATVEHDWPQFHRQKTNSLQSPRSSWIPMWLILPSDSLYSSNFYVYKGKSVSAIKVMCPMMSQGKTEIHAIPHSSESYPQQEHSES